VGVHYPLDVIAGSAVGLVTGYAVAHIFNKRFGLPIFDKQSF
jgi:membrane-associated phospholipid phosphatase